MGHVVDDGSPSFGLSGPDEGVKPRLTDDEVDAIINAPPTRNEDGTPIESSPEITHVDQATENVVTLAEGFRGAVSATVSTEHLDHAEGWLTSFAHTVKTNPDGFRVARSHAYDFSSFNVSPEDRPVLDAFANHMAAKGAPAEDVLQLVGAYYQAVKRGL